MNIMDRIRNAFSKAIVIREKEQAKATKQEVKQAPKPEVPLANQPEIKQQAKQIYKAMPKAATPTGHLNPRQKAAHDLFNLYNDRTLSAFDRRMAAVSLIALKKTTKVGWDRLGIRDIDGRTITDFAASSPVVQSAKPKKATPVLTPVTDKIDLSNIPSAMEVHQEELNAQRAERSSFTSSEEDVSKKNV